MADLLTQSISFSDTNLEEMLAQLGIKTDLSDGSFHSMTSQQVEQAGLPFEFFQEFTNPLPSFLGAGDKFIDREKSFDLRWALIRLDQATASVASLNFSYTFTNPERVKERIKVICEHPCWLSSLQHYLVDQPLYEGMYYGGTQFTFTGDQLEGPCEYIPELHDLEVGHFFNLDSLPLPVKKAARSSVILSYDLPRSRGKAQGSAVIVAPGYLLTARHVVDPLAKAPQVGENFLDIVTYDGKSYPVRLEKVFNIPARVPNMRPDLALVRVSGFPKTPETLPSISSPDLQPDDSSEKERSLFVIGAPSQKRDAISLSMAQIKPEQSFADKILGIQDLDGTSWGGVSGGPVVDDQGRLAGILVMGQITAGPLSSSYQHPSYSLLVSQGFKMYDLKKWWPSIVRLLKR